MIGISREIEFDMRNDLFAKIQRLSFSYHDRNQTGQLMIRATDDIEKVRLFIGQGLLQLPDAALQLPAMDQGGLEIGVFLHPAFLGGLQDIPHYMGAFHLTEKLQLPDELLIAGPSQENLFHAT